MSVSPSRKTDSMLHAFVAEHRKHLVAAGVELGSPLAHARQRSRLEAHPHADGLHGS